MSLSFGKTSTIVGSLAIGLGVGFLFKDSPQSTSSDIEVPSVNQRLARSSGPVVHALSQRGISPAMDESKWEELDRLQRLAFSDPTRALESLHSIADQEMRDFALAAIGRGWGTRDPQAAAGWIEGMESQDDQANTALGLIPVWAEQEPEDALAWSLRRAEKSTLRELSLLEVADGWTNVSPQQAMSAFLALPEEAGVERGMHVISNQWAMDAPDEAIRYVSSLPQDGRRDEFLEAVLVSLTNKDPHRTWREADLVADPGRVAHIRSQALEAIAETQPQQALKLLEKAGDPRLNALAIARGWAILNPQQAQEWAKTIGEPELRHEVMGQIEATHGNAVHAEQGN